MGSVTTIMDENKNEKLERYSTLRVVLRRMKRNKGGIAGLIVVLIYFVIAVIGLWIVPYHPDEPDFESALMPPNPKHPFGTDLFGRDVLSRVIAGARTSFTISIFAVALTVFIGLVIGTIAGYVGGWVDEVLMRFLDIFMAFPEILLAIAIVAILGPGKINIVIAIAVFSFPSFARITRASVISVKSNDYVEAAKAIGESDMSIMLRYILPNALSPVVVQATLRMGTAILTISSLGFLGLGVKAPEAEWGTELAMARSYLESAPWLSIFPGIAIVLVVLGFNFLGDALNDALNPRLKDR